MKIIHEYPQAILVNEKTGEKSVVSILTETKKGLALVKPHKTDNVFYTDLKNLIKEK